MRYIKSALLFSILFLTFNSYSTESFTFDPQTCNAQLDSSHIWFQDNEQNTNKVGPELYADETNIDFFNFVRNTIENAIQNNDTVILQFKEKNSESHGLYNCIIPEF